MKIYQYLKILKSHLRPIYEDFCYVKMFTKNYSDNQDVIFAKLRQNAHILDKGLNVQPFEPGHGKKVYEYCLELKSKINKENLINDSAYKWIEKVICSYEKAQLNEISLSDKVPSRMFSENEKTKFYHILKSRTSCRNFTNEIIDSALWNEIIELAIQAPSGCCRQTARFYVEDDQKKIGLLCESIAGATGFSGHIPYLICISSDVRSYSIQDRFLPYIDASLCIENFLLACTVNNIYGTPLNFQHATLHEIRDVKNILGMPEYEKIILFVAAGKVDFLPVKPSRLDIKNVRKK